MARSSEQRAPLGSALRLGHQNSVRHSIKHVLKHMLIKHVPQHVLGHMLKHVLRHVPNRHVLKHVPGHVPRHVPGKVLEHVPQNSHHEPASMKVEEKQEMDLKEDNKKRKVEMSEGRIRK